MTKKASRDWILTIDASKYSLDDVKTALEKYRWVGQREKGGKTGFEHYQIAIINDTPVRFETLKHKLPTAHIEPRNGTRQQLYDYCTKEDTRQEGPWFGGSWVDAEKLLSYAPGNRGDLEMLRDAIAFGDSEQTLQAMAEDDVFGPIIARNLKYAELLLGFRAKKQGAQRDDVRVFWYYGLPGTGKTTRLLGEFGDLVYRVTDYDTPWDGYEGQPIVMLEDFAGAIRWSVLLSLMEPWPMQLHARYANTWSNIRELYVVSNDRPSELYPGITGKRRMALYRRLEVVTDVTHMIPRTGLMQEEDQGVQPRKMWWDEHNGENGTPFTDWLREYDPSCFTERP